MYRLTRICLIASATLSLLWFLACAPVTHPTAAPPAALPDDAASLLLIAEQAYQFNGPPEAIARSLAAAEKLRRLEPDSERANFLAARAVLWLEEFGGDSLDRRQLAETGYRYALAALAKNDKPAEYHFIAGALLGMQMELALVPKLSDLKTVYDHLSRAIELDVSFEQGAPLRALGMLLIRAPAWPTGVGDPETGLEHLTRAAGLFPSFPANCLYLAEGYLALDRPADAAAPLQKARDLLAKEDWGTPGEVWRKQADKLAARLR
ncbi:MAG: hypothetical protein GX444_10125 [Myxococcales bacterium]|nr:hypothetical protein [Myxococcales bacterium]